MYPPVTQFETRHQMVLDELRVREQRRLARRSTPRTARATTLPMRLVRLLKVARYVTSSSEWGESPANGAHSVAKDRYAAGAAPAIPWPGVHRSPQ